jgi:O-antigen/teichoic acid export membrane protein
MMLRKLAGAWTPMARSAIGSVAIRAAAPALNLAVSIILVRLAGPHDYGIYIYCLAMVGLVLQPVTIGLSTSVIRHLAIYRMRCEWAYLHGVLRRGLQFSVTASVMLLLIGLLFVFFSLQIAPDSRPAFFVALALIPLFAFNSFCSSILCGLHHIIWGQVPEQIIVPVMLLNIVAVIGGIGLQINALILVWIQVIATAGVLLLSLVLISSRLPPEIHGVAPLYEDRYWLSGVVPLLVLGGSQQLNTEIVVIMLGQINDVENSGIYRLCARGAELVYFVLGALITSTAPTFSRLHAQGDLQELSRLMAKTTRVAFLASLPVALPLMFFSDWVLRFLYGPEFAVGATALAILCFGQLMCVITGPVGSLLMMTGHERDVVKGTLAALIVTILLALILIPRWGLNGAAVAAALGMVLRSAINCWHVYQRLDIKPLPYS